MTDPWSRPAEQPPQAYPTQPGQPGGPSAGPPPQGPPPQAAPPQDPPAESGGRFTRFFRDPVSIVLVVVIVLALVAAGLVGTELWARQRGDATVAQATQCIIQDDVSVSFGSTPLVWQYLTKHYTGITITTAGNNIREMKGMKAVIDVDDVRVTDGGESAGTIGSLTAAITWPAAGIKETLQSSIPIIGGFITDVTTNASDGTLELKVALGSIIVKPTVVDSGISVEVQKLTGLGFTLPRETVQPALDVFAKQIAGNYPMGVTAQSLTVTDTGIEAVYGARNQSMPPPSDEPCLSSV